jgi:hypothetical protein
MAFNQRIRELLERFATYDRDRLEAMPTADLTEDIAKDVMLRSAGQWWTNPQGEQEYKNVDKTARRDLLDRLLGRAAISADASTAPAVDLIGKIDEDPEYAARIIKNSLPPLKTKPKKE